MNDSPKRPFQAFLLKLADAPPAETYTTMMGCSATMLAINNHPVAFENIGDALRSLAATPAKLTLTGQGNFTQNGQSAYIEAIAKSGRVERAELYFDGGLRARCEISIGGLDFVGFVNGEPVWDILIESVGACHVE